MTEAENVAGNPPMTALVWGLTETLAGPRTFGPVRLKLSNPATWILGFMDCMA